MTAAPFTDPSVRRKRPEVGWPLDGSGGRAAARCADGGLGNTPMRPKPLIPTRIAMVMRCVCWWLWRRLVRRRTGWTKVDGSALRDMLDLLAADKNRLRIDGHTGILDLFACAQPCREPPSYNPSRAPHRQRYTTPWRSSCSLARRWPPSPSLTSPWAPSSASTSAPPTRCATAQPHLIAPACSH